MPRDEEQTAREALMARGVIQGLVTERDEARAEVGRLRALADQRGSSVTNLVDRVQDVTQQRDRALAAEAEARAESERLRAELDAARVSDDAEARGHKRVQAALEYQQAFVEEMERLCVCLEQTLNERDAAHDVIEAERTAKEEWERLRNACYRLYREVGVKLDAANALLGRLQRRLTSPAPDMAAEIAAHLAGQPAAPTRTAAEQRVLDCIRDLFDADERWLADRLPKTYAAELARREVSK